MNDLPSPALDGAAPLSHLGVIRVQGDDAAPFLHSQLTQDFLHLAADQARLAALLSPKGRMLTSMIGVWLANDDIALVCSRDLLVATLKRLSLFVLRAKARLSEATAQFQLWGLAGSAAQAALPPGATPWQQHVQGGAASVRLYPAAGQSRALWLAPADHAAPDAPSLAQAHWLWSEVASGVATLSAALTDKLVPQMLNYESIGGVSFKKGCYPGQEVVARSQFRGAIKRRTYLAHLPAHCAPGTEIHAAGHPDEPVGLVAQCANAPDGSAAALVVLQIAAADATLQTATGVPLTLQPLPYALLQDI